MNILPVPQIDLHVHSVASGHAFSTVGEIAAEAARKGLRAFALTDHGPALPGGPHRYHFHALRFIPPQLHGVRVLRGVEANILPGGELDLADSLLDTLDVAMAGFHEDCGYAGDRATNTEVLCTLIASGRVQVISHPGNPNFPIDYEPVAEVAARYGVALEFNNSSFSVSRRGSEENCRYLAGFCARYGTPVTVSSDAHIAQGVGEFGDALRILGEAGVRKEQIANRTLESARDFFGFAAAG